MDFVCNPGGPKRGVGFLASPDPPVNWPIVSLVNFLLYSLLKRSICAMILHGIIYDGCQHPWVPVFCVYLGLMPCNVMRERERQSVSVSHLFAKHLRFLKWLSTVLDMKRRADQAIKDTSLAEKAGLNWCKGWTKLFQRKQSSSCGTNSRWAKSRPRRKWVYNIPSKMISPIAHAMHLTNSRWLHRNASPFSVPTSPMKTVGWKKAKLRIVNVGYIIFPLLLQLHHC